MKFRKKPVIVEAVQYQGETGGPNLPKGVCDCGKTSYGIENGCQPHVHTIHDNQRIDVKAGDWIVAEPDGKHFYPVKPLIFEATYEPV